MDSLVSWKLDLEKMKERLNFLQPGPSRAKSIVMTKLDEARLWASEIKAEEEMRDHGID